MTTTGSFPRLHSKGKEYCAKLAKLIADGGTEALRKVFNQFHPPGMINSNLKSQQRLLQTLFTRGVISKHQWDVLFPPSGEPASSKRFGIKLLIVLIQNVCGVASPIRGWGNKPRRNDSSKQANIVRVTYFFSDIYEHASSRDIDVFHFFDYWNKIARTLLSLGISTNEVEYLQNAPIDTDKYLQVLFNWVVLGQEPCVEQETGKDLTEKRQIPIQDKLLGSIFQKQERVANQEKNPTVRKGNVIDNQDFIGRINKVKTELQNRFFNLNSCTVKGKRNSSHDILENELWYFGMITADEAEERLMAGKNPPGTFIIRELTNDQKNFFLSILRARVVRHYKIQKTVVGNKQFFISPRQRGAEPTRFNTLSELVKHYSQAPNGLCCRLTLPCPRESIEPDRKCNEEETNKSLPPNVKLCEMIYKHRFGHVYRGTWKGCVDVAVQVRPHVTMTSSASTEVFDLMAKLNHTHIIKLFAVYTNCKPFHIVTEPVKKGRLLDFLMSRNGRSLGLVQRIDIAAQVADAMMYLGQNNIIHRDLGARSVVINERGTCKIGHFELAKRSQGGEYIPRKHSETSFICPVRWTDPMCIVHGRFTDKSDVWSFGVFLMELMTHGAIPYKEMADCKVFDMVRMGYRLPQPAACPNALYELMLICWNEDERQRKNFAELHLSLRSHFYLQQ